MPASARGSSTEAPSRNSSIGHRAAEAQDRPLPRLPHRLEAEPLVGADAAHVVAALVGVRLERGGAASERVLDRRLEERRRDAALLRPRVDVEADDRPDAGDLVLRAVVPRADELSVLLARRDRDPADRAALLVSEQPRHVAALDDLLHVPLVLRAVAGPLPPEHAPTVCRHGAA